jgi:hypothetical protein
MALGTFDGPIREIGFSPDAKVLSAVCPTGTLSPSPLKVLLWRTAEVVAEPAASKSAETMNPPP